MHASILNLKLSAQLIREASGGLLKYFGLVLVLFLPFLVELSETSFLSWVLPALGDHKINNKKHGSRVSSETSYISI
jgi:hypothetical protein